MTSPDIFSEGMLDKIVHIRASPLLHDISTLQQFPHRICPMLNLNAYILYKIIHLILKTNCIQETTLATKIVSVEWSLLYSTNNI